MRVNRFLSSTCFAFVLTAANSGSADAQILWNNGPVVDANGRSVIRTGGGLYGAGAQTASSNTVADDFTVPGAGWTVSGFNFFSYQTLSGGQFTFTGVTWAVVSGDVNSGAIVGSGTAVPTDGGLVGYRVTGATLANTSRAIFKVALDVPDFALGAGTYWLRWSLTGSQTLAGPWVPPTSDGVSGNAQQSQSGGAFQPLFDSMDQGGNELPFEVVGTEHTQVPEPSSLVLMCTGGLALFGVARRRHRR